MLKEKLTFVGQFGARGIAFNRQGRLIPMPTIARWRHSISAGVNSAESLIK